MNWCTGWFDGNWGHCCAMHDVAYTMQLDKLKADIDLWRCVAEAAGPIMASIMFVGVLLFGGFAYKNAKNYKNSEDGKPYDNV